MKQAQLLCQRGRFGGFGTQNDNALSYLPRVDTFNIRSKTCSWYLLMFGESLCKDLQLSHSRPWKGVIVVVMLGVIGMSGKCAFIKLWNWNKSEFYLRKLQVSANLSLFCDQNNVHVTGMDCCKIYDNEEHD